MNLKEKSLNTERSAKLVFQYQAFSGLPAKLKIEINISEHLQILPLRHELFIVNSDWFSGTCEIVTYELAELMATKLRALFQRRKGRDLFDLWFVFRHSPVDVHSVIEIFKKYCAHDGILISKELFHKNLELKRLNRDFQIDMNILLPHQIQWNFGEAFDFVYDHIINQIS